MALTAEQQALDFNPELQDVNRQRKLADLLMAQGMQQPQGQMISGYYVAPSFAQQLNPMANMLAGQTIGNRADTEQAKLAEVLRAQKGEALSTFQQLMAKPETRGQAMQYAASNRFLQPLAAKLAEGMKLAEGEKFVMPGMDGQSVEVASGGAKYRAPLQIDTGTAIEIRDPNDPTKVLQRLPKTHVFAPHANQLVPVAGGFAEYNPNTKTLLPIGGGQGGATGTPTGALMPPLPQHLQTEVSSINQQKSTINDVLKSVEQNRQYFGTKYAAPEILAGELGASKMNEKLPSSAVESRSQVFNTASSVIKERAGTAQSKNESAVIMRFLPSIYDNDKVIIDKLNGFNKYLESKEKGITSVVGAVPTYRPGATQPPAVTTGNKVQNFDPALLQFMTPEQQALFKQPGN
jgi:hypothetical protein